MNEHPETKTRTDADIGMDDALDAIKGASRFALKLAREQYPELAQVDRLNVVVSVTHDGHWSHVSAMVNGDSMCGYGNANVGMDGSLAAAFADLAAQVTEARHE